MTVHAENWVGEYTSTVGDGDIILGGQIDGFCGFANVGEGVDVYYTIMDALNKETGIGTVAGGKLVRKTIHAVLLEGTYIKGGSPLELSGDAQVYLTANSHFMDYVIGIDNSLTEAIGKINALNQVTINGHNLQGNMVFDASSFGARPDTWMPTAEEIGAYSKSASDQRYVASDQVETGEQPGKIMIVGGPRDKQLVQKIDQADQTLQQNLDDAKQTLQQNINNVAVTFIGPNPPQNAPEGKKWYDTNSGRSYIYLNDGDSKQWVEESPQGNGVVDTSPLLLAMSASNFGPLSFRNILINGDMRVNQRGFNGLYSSIAEGAYGYDRWKKSGINITQVVESGNFINGASYVLSGKGMQPTKMIAPASGDWSISVINTVTDIQLELGDLPTPFERRPYSLELQLCSRYYFKPAWADKQVFFKNLSWSSTPITFPVEMRIAPHAIALTTANTIGDVAGMAMNSRKQAFYYSFTNGNPGVVEVGLAFDAEL